MCSTMPCGVSSKWTGALPGVPMQIMSRKSLIYHPSSKLDIPSTPSIRVLRRQ
jgi:hypothetical protein